jgi:Zn-finger protein
MNFLKKWEQEHFKKITKELEDAKIPITLENIPEIIKETSFEIRSKNHGNECPYYSLGYSCHTQVKDLNCLLCACPDYDSSSLEGGCKINKEEGRWHYHPALPKQRIWDCSNCSAYHSSEEVEDYLRENLGTIAHF